jgi:TonB-dependent Receptor Plug Domain
MRRARLDFFHNHRLNFRGLQLSYLCPHAANRRLVSLRAKLHSSIRNKIQPMEKPMIRNVQQILALLRVALLAGAAFPLITATSLRAQEPAAPPPTGTNVAPTNAVPAATEATAERVIVTGSNIPTAEEVGPNPVDTYRRDDITRLGVRTPTDLILRVPSATGSNTTENNTNGGDGTTRISLRGIDPKETLVCRTAGVSPTRGFRGIRLTSTSFRSG